MTFTSASSEVSIQTRSKIDWCFVVVVLALIGGAVLRWLWLGRASLWYDEGYTAWIVSHPASEIIRLIRADTAPPLYYLLLRGWVNCFGNGETALRSFSAVISTLVLVAFYPLAFRVTRDRWVSALTVVLLALSYMQVERGREARFYPLMTLLAEINLLLVLTAVEERAIWKYAGLIVVWGMSLYTNNMLAFYLAGLGLAWLVLPGRRSLRGRLLDLSIVSLAAAILFLPWVPTAMAQSWSLQGNFWVPVPTRAGLVHTVINLAGANKYALGEWGRLNTRMAGGFILLVVSAGLAWRETRRQAAALVVFGLLPVIVVYFYSQVRQSIFVDRSFIVSAMVFPLLLVLPLLWLRRKFGGLAILVYSIILIVPSVWSLQLNDLARNFEDWRSACRDIAEHPDGRQLFVFVGNEGELLYDYYVRAGDYSRHSNTTGAPNDFFDINPPHTMQRVRSAKDLEHLKLSLAADDYDEVVLVDSHYWWSDHGCHTRNFLDKTFSRESRTSYGVIVIYRWDAHSVTMP